MDVSPALLQLPLLDRSFPLPVEHPFTTSRATEAGISKRRLADLASCGLLRRMLRGVYVATQMPDSVELRTEALALVVPPDCVVVDWTACWLWTGLLAPGQHLDVPPVSLFRPSGRGRLRNGLSISGERMFARGDTVDLDGLTVSSPLRTAWDLGRFFHRDTAIGGIDALLRHGTFALEELVGGVERFRRQRGVVPLREVAPLADGRSESPGESTLRLRWVDLGDLPRPRPQVPILNAVGVEVARIDLGLEELRFGMEYDGEEFHSTEEAREHDRRRRAWLLRDYGWLVRGVRRDNVYGKSRDVEKLIYEGFREARATAAERFRRVL